MFWTSHAEHEAGGSVHSSSCIGGGAGQPPAQSGRHVGASDQVQGPRFLGTQNEHMNTAETTAAPCPQSKASAQWVLDTRPPGKDRGRGGVASGGTFGGQRRGRWQALGGRNLLIHSLVSPGSEDRGRPESSPGRPLIPTLVLTRTRGVQRSQVELGRPRGPVLSAAWCLEMQRGPGPLRLPSEDGGGAHTPPVVTALPGPAAP